MGSTAKSLSKLPRPSVADVQAHAGQAAQLLKALANEQRLLVLCLLVDGERSVGEINEHVALSQSALSQHLALLRESGVVTARREAQTVWYTLAPGPAQRVMVALYESFCAPDRSRRAG
jgi:ArsR family transcriptional regulator, virulence genes transcriptional regulator